MTNTILSTTSVQQTTSPVTSNVIQISTTTGIIAIVVFIFGLGLAWGTMKNQISTILEKIGKIEPELKDIRERFSSLEGKANLIFASASPIALMQKGKDILEKSGFKKYIDNNADGLYLAIKTVCKMENAYDIQECIFDEFNTIDLGEFESKLKQTAFDNGIPTSTVRRIGAIYFRDICLEKSGFNPKDLDKPKNVNKF